MNKFAAAASVAAEADPVDKAIPVVPGRTLHVDGDYMAYYYGFPDVEGGVARANSLNFINRAKRASGSEKAVVHLTSSNCHKGWRYLIATVKPYQAQRPGGQKPKNWALLREFMAGYKGEDFTPKNWASREADDGMAACAHYAARNGKLDAILTKDKDMRMFPGIHLSWDDFDIQTTVPQHAYEVRGNDGKLYGYKWFWQQMLQGDTADNIPGLEFIFTTVGRNDSTERMVRCGEKTAEKALFGITAPQACPHVIDLYRRSYRGTGDGDDRFVEQAALLWMRHDNAAAVNSFAQHWGPFFDDKMWEAVGRLEARVANARKELEALSQ